MITVGAEQITALFAGQMGIQAGYAGNDLVFGRVGSYFYLDLDTSGGQAFIPSGQSTTLITADGQEFLCAI